MRLMALSAKGCIEDYKECVRKHLGRDPTQGGSYDLVMPPLLLELEMAFMMCLSQCLLFSLGGNLVPGVQ